jgi:hypothetical protein
MSVVAMRNNFKGVEKNSEVDFLFSRLYQARC